MRRIVVTPYAAGSEHELAMPEEVYDTGPATNAEFTTSTLRFTYTSLVTPGTVFDEDLDTGERTLLKTTEVVGGHDPADYVTGRLWATAPDGVRVPISYVHRADVARDGQAPCLLYGYGSYETCIDPGFSILRLSLLDRGFVFAIAHVRGGGEMGRPWYDDGKLLHKRNTFTDFIACAEHLVAERLHGPRPPGGARRVGRRAPHGRHHQPPPRPLRRRRRRGALRRLPDHDPRRDASAHRHRVGGVGQPRRRTRRCTTTWRATAPTTTSPSRPTPRSSPPAGSTIPASRTGSRRSGCYKLRASTTSGRPIFLKTEMGAGHQGPSGRYDAWRDEAFVFAFILDALGRS